MLNKSPQNGVSFEIERHAYDFESLPFECPVKPDKVGDLLAARTAPGGKEVQDDNTTSKVAQAMNTAIKILECKVWSSMGDKYTRFFPATTSTNQKGDANGYTKRPLNRLHDR
jgi:hypothetical protein